MVLGLHGETHGDMQRGVAIVCCMRKSFPDLSVAECVQDMLDEGHVTGLKDKMQRGLPTFTILK